MADLKKLNNKVWHIVWDIATKEIRVLYGQEDMKHTTYYDKDAGQDGEKTDTYEEIEDIITANELIFPGGGQEP